MNKQLRMVLLLALMALMVSQPAEAQRNKKETKGHEKSIIEKTSYAGLKLRNIGPAFASGRIADIVVNPNNFSEWYVGVASGNIWKTTNNGITFTPVFDNYNVYSIGAMAIDPNNTHVVWAGTGENNHQRALAYGDGVYKSLDGGQSWTNMGLKDSRQIGGIVIDPRNSDIVFVAAEGSVWGPGGDRGLYKTTDGGKTWEKVLDISENTGVNNIKIDPSNPDVMYATSEQRRRHVHTKIGGGPESAVYKSEDAGKTWRKIMKGLPGVHIGGMGIDVSPVNPNIVYIIMEAAQDASGFYRSTNKGESWHKMSSHASSGQYYNEIYCDPVDANKVYSVETYSHFTEDGGKTWKRLSNNERHVDDHALWINPNDPKHLIIGGDGGVYITYDSGNDWRHVSNLPITQYYRVTVDNSEPFYWVYGGTQDNNSMGGPSQNTSTKGVVSEEWVVTLGGDGFWNRVDPKDPNIVYSEYQYGNVYRYDKKSGEQLYIKPQPRKDELTFRWNWNTPLIISPHNHKRLYIAANKLFRTDDRGQSWKVLSDDLTAQIDRTNTWPVMGKYWSSDAVQKDVSTSLYGTIVSLDESPVKENLIYVGTDDGLIQVTENADAQTPSWNKIESFPGVPANTYVSDIFASRFDENVVFASFDNRKRDDFKPYLLKSTNKGKSWTSITNGLPENGTVHTIEQDFKNKNLLFVGTEFGLFFSVDAGSNWVQLKNGLPTIAVRDLAIQQRETDLALATFGRGFYILDDYSPLRDVNETNLEKNALFFPVQDALSYVQTGGRYGQGSTYFAAKNPPFGATFTFYLKDVPKTKKQLRQEKEKELFKNGQKIPQISWKELEDEDKEISPYLIFTIKDEKRNVVRKIFQSASKGIHRINWDLEYQSDNQVSIKDGKFNPTSKTRGSFLVMPGKYTVSMQMVANEIVTDLNEPQEFNVVPLNNTTLPAPERAELVAFLSEVMDLSRVVYGTKSVVDNLMKQTTHMMQAAHQADAPRKLYDDIAAVYKQLDQIRYLFEGDQAKASWEEVPPQKMPLLYRMSSIMRPHSNSTSAVTQVQKDGMTIMKEKFKPVYQQVKELNQKTIPELETQLENAKAALTPGRLPEWNEK